MVINRSKHGQGHLEFVLSFAIFLGFLIFIFVFLNPIARSENTVNIA